MRRRPTWRRNDDEGLAMLVVVSSMMVLFMLSSAVLAYAVQGRKSARGGQDWSSALSAAQAGIEDYISRLNRNDDYARSWDCTGNVALRGPAAPGNTCGWTATTAAGFLPVPGSANGATFHYDVDPSNLDRSGTIQVTSTGKIGATTRTLQVAVGRGGSTDFLYYTDYEHADPDNEVVYPNDSANGPWCNGVDPSTHAAVKDIYWFNGRSGKGCVEITFIGGDVLNGPVHLNDTAFSTSLGGTVPKFVQKFETADPRCKLATAATSTWGNCVRSGNAVPNFGVKPIYHDPLYLTDNSGAFASYPGCQYVGPTRIKLNANGTMSVWSKFSTAATSACGGAAVRTAAGASNVAVPDGQVIYASNGGASRQCAGGEIGDGLPLGTDNTLSQDDQLCDKGNIFLEGTLKGRLSIAAQNSIVVTGDVMLDSGIDGADMLGLVASNSVEVYHPWVTTTVNTSCKVYAWDKTAGAWVNKAFTTSPNSGKRYGYADGRWNNTTNPTSWSAGNEENETNPSGNRTEWYQGATSATGTNNGYDWVTPSSGKVWKPGTWTLSGSGTWQFTNGSWVNPPSGQTTTSGYYRADEYDRGACLQWNTTTSQGESPDWPHTTGAGIQIFASIQTLNHSFYVQNYDEGSSLGTLSVWGSIAQRWRGIVGQGSGTTGYLKNYQYDKRLKYSSPPYFPQWANAKWGARYTGEVTPMYRG